MRGPTAWLWSHGYEFREREGDVRRIYAGAPDAVELLRYYSVDFVFLGDAERNDLRADASFFDGTFALFYSSPRIRIYDVRQAGNDRGSNALMPPRPRELASLVERDPYQLLVEFPRTSFFVYRFFRVSYGRLPRREEFLSAMRSIGRGVFIGAPGCEQQLETNTRSLINDWMDRDKFQKA